MESSKQSQKAGDNSTQVQAGVINNYYNGINESRARQICKAEYAVAKQNWTQEAIAIADERVRQLEDKLLPKMMAYDNSLKFFADPAFQITLRQAQITAASSDRESDCDILSDLLLHRLEHGDDLQRRLGICKAIEVVDKISDEALLALSVVYAVLTLVPRVEDMLASLSMLNNLYGALWEHHQLPSTEDWMEHLDLLSAVRLGIRGINPFSKMKDIVSRILSQYLVSGIEESSEEFAAIKSKFIQYEIPISCIIPHPLKPNYVKLSTSTEVEKMLIVSEIGGNEIRTPLNENQKEAMR
ncbi:MAG: hypothetical protein K2M99_02515, partial [Treponemataceae bacterium]|nr:hypothetical protein [Treponemataceae bacterium]